MNLAAVTLSVCPDSVSCPHIPGMDQGHGRDSITPSPGAQGMTPEPQAASSVTPHLGLCLPHLPELGGLIVSSCQDLRALERWKGEGKALNLGLDRSKIPQARQPQSFPWPRSPGQAGSFQAQGRFVRQPEGRFWDIHDVPLCPRASSCPVWRWAGTHNRHSMPLRQRPLTEGSKSTLVMLPPAPSRVWLASRRPGGEQGKDR